MSIMWVSSVCLCGCVCVCFDSTIIFSFFFLSFFLIFGFFFIILFATITLFNLTGKSFGVKMFILILWCVLIRALSYNVHWLQNQTVDYECRAVNIKSAATIFCTHSALCTLHSLGMSGRIIAYIVHTSSSLIHFTQFDHIMLELKLSLISIIMTNENWRNISYLPHPYNYIDFY